ncbi:MAG TPA: SurA N-terminal domain-containing protein [Nitrospirota bacterium]|nr:SurA N-terminal domain-containing protein [Nitrospirota bacterium]
MLESMHKHMKWIMWIIVGLITVAFLFFGIYPSDSGRGMAASVNGDVITTEEWNRVYQNMHDMYREILKGKFDEGFAKTLRAQALRELVTERLLVQEAERQGLRVTDQELQAAIMRIPAFNQQGVFSQTNYEGYLRQDNMTPALFETQQREVLLRQKIEHLVEDSVDVTDAELPALYAAKNPKAKPGDFQKNRTSFRQSVLKEKQRAALDGYVARLGNKAKIKVGENTFARD